MGWLSLLKFIPGLSSLLTWAGNTAISLYSAKLSSQGAHEAKIVELAARELAVEEREIDAAKQAKSEIRHIWYAPENLMFYFIALPYWMKAITFDNVVGPLLGLEWATPALRGDTAKAMMMVMAFWFGLRGVQSVGATIVGAVAAVFKR